jgi:hypothetical protein
LPLTFVALIFAILAFRGTQLQIRDSQVQLKQQVYHDLMSEYRSPEMFNALQVVGNIARITRGKSRITIAINYREQLSKNAGIAAYYRMVMLYYYEMALVTEDEAIKELFYRVWTKENLSIIPDLIIPQETFLDMRSIPDQPGKVEEIYVREEEYPMVLRLLKRLYDEAPD